MNGSPGPCPPRVRASILRRKPPWSAKPGRANHGATASPTARLDEAAGRTYATATAGVALLRITGDDAGPDDEAWSQLYADQTGAPVYTLFQVPNQPRWDLTEDELIAHTVMQARATGDPSWILLFPMVRSAIAALDAAQTWSQGRDTRFFLIGSSKRAWTSWLAANTGDPRIAGIVPVVFDNLDFPAQMRRQYELWGQPSPAIAAYTQYGLPAETWAPDNPFVPRVDPMATLGDRPALVINGANDPYWTVDALARYHDRLPPGSQALVCPNMGHAKNPWRFWLPTVREFVHGHPLGVGDPVAETVWRASAPTAWFAASLWDPGEPEPNSWQAELTVRQFQGQTGLYRLSDPVKLSGPEG